MNQIKREDLQTKWRQYLNVGQLKDFIERNDIPDTAKVLVQRVTDMYYNGVDISGMRGCTQEGSDGIFPPGSRADGWPAYTKNTGTEYESEYSPAWCCVRYKDDKDILFIDLHY